MTMHTKSDYDKFESSSAENRRLLRQEELILETSNQICKAMEHANVSKAELASRLGATKGHVTQLLSGGRNLTLRSIANVCDALGFVPRLDLHKKPAQWTETVVVKMHRSTHSRQWARQHQMTVRPQKSAVAQPQLDSEPQALAS